jgi:hypothetical protein
MGSYCEVRQIYSGTAFINVQENIDGRVMVWGSTYTNKTVLVFNGINFSLYQFENEEFFKEWLENNRYNSNEIFLLQYDNELRKNVIVKID